MRTESCGLTPDGIAEHHLNRRLAIKLATTTVAAGIATALLASTPGRTVERSCGSNDAADDIVEASCALPARSSAALPTAKEGLV